MPDETHDHDEQQEGTEAESHAEHQEAPKATTSAKEFIDEMSNLGQKLGQAIQDVLDPEQRRAIRAKVTEEIKTAGDQVQSLAKELRTGKVGGKDIQTVVVDELRQAKGQVETLAKEVSSSKAAQEFSEKTETIGRKLGEGLLSGLRALNRELGKAIQPDEGKKKDDPPETDKP